MKNNKINSHDNYDPNTQITDKDNLATTPRAKIYHREVLKGTVSIVTACIVFVALSLIFAWALAEQSVLLSAGVAVLGICLMLYFIFDAIYHFANHKHINPQKLKQKKVKPQKTKKQKIKVSKTKIKKPYPSDAIFSKGEEIFNAVSHIVAAALALVATALMIVRTALASDTVAAISVIIYGISLFILYLASSIYHFLRHNRAKKVFRVFDHCAIFLLIAGTYTPYCLITLSNSNIGLFMLAFVWILAIIGVTFNAINMHHKVVVALSQISYILMGWCVIFSISPLLKVLPFAGFIWLLIGGILYTAGVIFFALGRKVKYFHSIWHLFVLAGSIAQFISIYWYVVLPLA